MKPEQKNPQLHYKGWKWVVSFPVNIPNNLYVNIQSCAVQGLSCNPQVLW